VVILAVLRNADLSHPAEHAPRYGVRLGLGLLLLVAGVVIARRSPRGPDPRQPGIVSRMAAEPAPWRAFVVGILIFAPGATFLASMQVIATARATLGETVLAVIIVVVINVLLVWLPILAHVLVPGWTVRYLTLFNSWLREHNKTVVVWVFLVVGAIMVGNGIYGLAA
jgi:Sap, sulfolipid-1-addressing protein